jgi:hypothetical protein
MASDDSTVASIWWLLSAASWVGSAPTAMKVTLAVLTPAAART